MKIIMSWFLSIITLLGGLFGTSAPDSGSGAGLTEPAVSAFHAVLEAEKPAPALLQSGAHADVDYADMAYEHYDPQPFYDDADRLCELSDAGDTDAVLSLYDELYDRFVYVDTLYALAMLRHDASITSEYWQDEYAYTENLWMEMGDALSSAGAYVLEGSASEAFSEHIGPALTADFIEYEPLTDEQVELNDRELELEEEYYALNDAMADISFEYRGESWTWEKLYGEQGDRLARRDYDGYITVYYGIQKAMWEMFAPVFVELTQLRTEQARQAGYDSFSDYAYERVFGRDYTPADAQIFCDAVKPIAREYFADLYYSDLFEEAAYVGADLDTAAMFAAIEAHLPLVDESLSEPWAYMTAHGLYDVAPAAPGRYDGAYTTGLSYYGAPFILMSGEGGCYDFITMTHEFGHYADYYFSPAPDVLSAVSDYDLNETHSNGLQALFTSFYGDIFGSEADAAAFLNLSDLLENVIDGCMYDEFQRRVFKESDSLTPERVNEIYLDICLDYGLYEPYDLPDYDAGWVYIGHLFLSPSYYISYAASGFAALQIWDMAQEDFDAAVRAYMTVLRAGAYENGYFTVLAQSGLRDFTEEDAVEDVLSLVLDHLAEMERRTKMRWS